MIEGAYYVDGKVALRYYQPIPKMIKVENENYFFDCQHGISMAFVEEKDVPKLLSFLGGCCGGKRLVISLASEAIYKHWLEGRGGRN
jgi:hypothetical protein